MKLGLMQRASLEDVMTMMPSMRTAALAMAVLVSVPALALAQTAGAPAAPATAPNAAASGGDAGARARVEARINQLHTQLRITPAEETQWNQFAETMRANAREMQETAAKTSEQLPTTNAVQALQSYEQLTEAHVQRLQKLIPAFEALYTAMSPEQKQIADQVFRSGAAARSNRAAAAAGVPHGYSVRGRMGWSRNSMAEQLNRQEFGRISGGAGMPLGH